MDFDDLLFKTNVLLRDFPDLLHKYQQKFAFILVDEYQDTNFAQYLIIRQLGAARENVCVVGDDAQSIYSFRGANIQNILNFQRDYPDCVVYKLEQNYRSTKTIVEAANTVIAKNQDQIRKEVWTGNADGDKIDVHRALSDNDEGSHVADGILTTRSGSRPATRTSPSSTGPTPSPVPSRSSSASATFPTASTGASASTSARRSRT